MATDGGVLVADTTHHRVVHWAPGAEAGTVVAGGRGPGGRLEQLSYPYGIAPNWTRGPIGPLVGFIYMRYDYDNYIISFVHLSPKFWGGREPHQSKTTA